MAMSRRRNRLETTILVVLPLLVVTSIVCPVCSAMALGGAVAPSCGGASSVAAAAGHETTPGCHPTAPLALRAAGAGASCCAVDTAQNAERPTAVPVCAGPWTVALVPTAGIEDAPATPAARCESPPSRLFDTPLYRLHRALLI